MDYLQKQYITEASVYLDKFKWANGGRVANFRCPYCGDSEKHSNKRRGYFYISKHGNFVYTCKNCGVGGFGISTFLKQLYPSLYTKYKLERIKELYSVRKQEPKPIETIQEEIIQKPNNTLVALTSLPNDHIAQQYLRERKIPETSWSKILYTDDYAKLINEVCPWNESDVPNDKRIVFELIDEEGKLFGYQGRSLDKECQQRYITIKFDKTKSSIWGLQYINRELPVIAVEGIMDALFLPNTLAILGGDINSASEILKSLSNVVVAFDNEPRHVDTVRRMEKAIQIGLAVCFWKYDPKYKDINDMVMKGDIKKQEILRHIFQNSKSGSKAKLEMIYWKKTETKQGVTGGRQYAN